MLSHKVTMPFVVFEGIDGAGKSTLIQSVAQILEDRGVDKIITREPGGTPFGDAIRSLILDNRFSPHPLAELFLLEASRAQHVEEVIRPALLKHKWVLCDRFSASSVAFQSGGRGVLRSIVEHCNEYAQSGLRPDLQILLDLDPQESLRRRTKRDAKALSMSPASSSPFEVDRFEREQLSFHERVRKAYLEMANSMMPSAYAEPSWLILDATQETSFLATQVIKAFFDRGWLR